MVPSEELESQASCREKGTPSMLKSELVRRVAEQNAHLYLRDVENVVDAIVGEIVAALVRGERVELRGFGVFSTKSRPARAGRNPRTGAHVSVHQKRVALFKTGKEMRKRLNRTRVISSLAPAWRQLVSDGMKR